MGSGESRVHFPKGGVKGAAATAAKVMRTNAKTLTVCARWGAEKETFSHSGTSFLSASPRIPGTRAPAAGAISAPSYSTGRILLLPALA
jgi:hypothetical protein